jgi:hypothetical protein
MLSRNRFLADDKTLRKTGDFTGVEAMTNPERLASFTSHE